MEGPIRHVGASAKYISVRGAVDGVAQRKIGVLWRTLKPYSTASLRKEAATTHLRDLTSTMSMVLMHSSDPRRQHFVPGSVMQASGT